MLFQSHNFGNHFMKSILSQSCIHGSKSFSVYIFIVRVIRYEGKNNGNTNVRQISYNSKMSSFTQVVGVTSSTRHLTQSRGLETDASPFSVCELAYNIIFNGLCVLLSSVSIQIDLRYVIL